MQIKKLFAVMMIALLTFMTMATGQVAQANDDVITSGSLTIHKYEREPGVDDGEDGDGTVGQEVRVPDDAELLDGVTFKITKTHSYDPATDKWTAVENGAVHEEITENGVALFDGLALGRYTVEETAGPAHVNLNPNIYSVDIPMTSADGTDINYNVHIYPKNEIIRGAVKLKKIDGENGFVGLPGAEFNLYDSDDNLLQENVAVNSNGYIYVDGLAYGDYYFTEVVAPEGYVLQSGKFTFSISESGTINEDGESTGTVERVKVKNYYKPVIEKEVDAEDANRGDTLTYTLTIDLPGDVQNYKNFVITDVLDYRLSYVDGSQEMTPSAGFAFAQSGQTLTWTVSDFAALENGGTVVITFEATIDEDAVGDSIENTGTIDYENESGTEGEEKSNTPEVPLTDGGFKVLKVDAANTATTLAGAEFKLTDEDGNTIDTTGTLITVNDVLHNGLLEDLVTDANGEIKIDGLDVGTYYLVETKAPTYDDNGVEKSYRMLTQPIQVDVADGDSSSTKTVTVENSKSGWDLPKTGGIGTTLFSGVGLLLMGAAIFILARRKNSAIQ